MVNWCGARQKLDGLDVLRRLDWDVHDDVTKHVMVHFVARLEYVGTRHRHDEARLAAFPTAGKLRRRWTSPRVAFRRAAFDPALNEVDLLCGETAFPKEPCRCAIGRPRRHPPLERYGGNVGRFWWITCEASGHDHGIPAHELDGVSGFSNVDVGRDGVRTVFLLHVRPYLDAFGSDQAAVSEQLGSA